MSDRNPPDEGPIGGSRGPLIALRRLARRVFALRYSYEQELDRQRAMALSAICLIFGLIGVLGTPSLWLFAPHLVSQIMLVTDVILGALYLLAYRSVQRGHLRRASFAFIALTWIVPLVQHLAFGFIGLEAVYLSLAVPVVGAALLLGSGWTFPAAGAAIASVAAIGYFQSPLATTALSGEELTREIEQITLTAGVGGFLIGALSLFAWLLSSSLFRWAENAQRHARQLEAAAVISETSATTPSLNVLLNVVVERIRDAFGFYHAQVFLIDPEGRFARLEASTGRAGVALLARGHALRVGSQSVIGQCAFLGTPIVVNDTQLSTVWRPNELLPDTRAELALPLLVGSAVIGVLDVQSILPNVFGPDDIRALQIMAQQLATTIEKTRLVEALQARAAENQRLYEEAQRSLRQIEDLNRRLTREGWSEFLRARRAEGVLGYTLAHQQIENDTTWTAPMRQAYQGERSVVVRQDQNAHIAALPLRIRGEVIGVLEVERGGDHPWTDEDLDIAETLVERLALAIENARLFEQATRATEREQVINKIAQDMQTAETVEQILQAALAELGSVLGASRGIVQISPKSEQPRSGRTGPLPQLEQ